MQSWESFWSLLLTTSTNPTVKNHKTFYLYCPQICWNHCIFSGCNTNQCEYGWVVRHNSIHSVHGWGYEEKCHVSRPHRKQICWGIWQTLYWSYSEWEVWSIMNWNVLNNGRKLGSLVNLSAQTPNWWYLLTSDILHQRILLAGILYPPNLSLFT